MKLKNPASRLLQSSLLAAFAMTAMPQQMVAASYTQLTNLPTLYIETENGASITSKEEYITCTLHYVDESGVVTDYENVSIRGRGNSTWNLAKKPYRIKFETKTKFLGDDRAKAKSWTLLANHADKTLIRNAVAAYIGDLAGQPFTAAAKFIDLYLNGTYQGNYQISDQIDVRKKRVNIVEQEEVITDESDITGGYLLEVDGFASSEPVNTWFTTNKGITITIKSPDDDVLVTRQYNYIKDYVQQFETALFSSNFDDAEKGYRPFVDPETLSSWYVASEATGNVDCFWSTYFYKDQGDDKLYWGPLWDYDIAFNNDNRKGDTSKSLMKDVAHGDKYGKIWATQFWKDSWFVKLINKKWKSMIADGAKEKVLAYIDQLAEEIDQSQTKNFQKYSIRQRVHYEYQLFNSYSQGVSYLKQYISDHFDYLTTTFADAAGPDTDPDPDTTDPGTDPDPGTTDPDTGTTDPGTDPDPGTTDTEDFPSSSYYYYIQNVGTSLYADLSAGTSYTELNSSKYGAESQQWYFEPSDAEGYYRIVNRSTGLAMTDAATYSYSGYTTGSRIELSNIDTTDDAQLWSLSQVNDEEKYVVVNRKTNLAWNNRGGDTSDGTELISWTNDSQNVSKPTRQWTFTVSDNRNQQSAVDDFLTSPDYILTYCPEESMLHFYTTDDSILDGGVVYIFSTSGSLVAKMPTAADIDVSNLARGMYIVSWQMGKLRGSVKFVR